MALAATRNSLDLSCSLLGFVGSVATVLIPFMGPLIDISGAPLNISYIILLLPPVFLFSLVGLIRGWLALDRLQKCGERQGRAAPRWTIALACIALLICLVWLAWLPSFFYD
jgi:hypothetical protein